MRSLMPVQGEKTVETIAVYWEQKPKIYGFKEAMDLSLINIAIKPEKISQWGLWLIELSEHHMGFHLILAKYSMLGELRLYMLIEKLWVDSLLSYIGKKIDPDSGKDLYLTRQVELISFQGPHFGDRYGIADTAFKVLDDHKIPILIAACSGAAVYLVLPEKKLHEARPLLAEVFEVP
jgi:aspartokinase